MKTKRNILITVLVLAISVFAALPRSFGQACVDRTVTVNQAAGSLKAEPERIDICSGNTLTIRIVPPVDIGKARSIDDPANPIAAPWITKTNWASDKITILVPEGTTVTTYKYLIKIEGVGTLDPRARVTQ